MKNFKKAMKNFKKVRLSLGMKIIALLSCVALLSMGFASWWIIKPVEAAYTTGSFTAYDVVTKELHIGNVAVTSEGTTEEHQGKIIFGKPNNAGNAVWLVAGDEIEDEKLSTLLIFTVSVKNPTDATTNAGQVDTSAVVQNLVNSVDVTITLPEKVADAVKANYLATPSLQYAILSNYTANTDYTATSVSGTSTYTGTATTTGQQKITLNVPMPENTTGTVTVALKLSFAWGTAIGSANPYTYFNGLDLTTNTPAGVPSDNQISAAKTALQALKDCATGDAANTKFVINFKANLGSN